MSGLTVKQGDIIIDDVTRELTLKSSYSPIIDTTYTFDGDYNTGTTPMVADDTIPQNTEGNEFITHIHTPEDALNLLEIEHIGYYAKSAVQVVIAALFKDSDVNAMKAGSLNLAVNSEVSCLVLRHFMIAGTVSPIDFKIRAGLNGAGTCYFNGDNVGRWFAGAMASHIKVTEYAKS